MGSYSIHLTVLFAFLTSLGVQIHALSPEYTACQLQKSVVASPLTGCPKGTIFVSPTDDRASFKKVQDAIKSLPETGDAIILIGEGEYNEMVNVARAAPLTLLGQLDPYTAYDSAGNASQRNLVHIWNNLYVHDGLTDEETATLTVAPASGEHFGNTNFRAYNIDFENRAANYAISQALVTSLNHVNASFYGCTFASYQDTWYTGSGAYTYAVDSIIYGSTDYLFGYGTAVHAAPGMGLYIADSKIIRSPDASATTVTNAQCYLGRPWNDLAIAVYLRTYMDESIPPQILALFHAPLTTPSLIQYGPGGGTSKRVAQDHIMTSEEVDKYFTLEEVFFETPAWIDFKYKY
ncbi:carbohydrate esterase family 8 protein [Suillus paluster]|uniref:carbohydrate esterase family 8 protein n=1 Tax=Suillus paluster TaxID=48578 RepID=UPI001B866AEF|nr:carbohydrate esterase family 8 protein [Suillus paluster]KAG1743204.1 carbohydrate esterase family 8 protein [Suillus paluster]